MNDKTICRCVDIFRGLVPPVENWEMRTFHATFAVYKNRIVCIGLNQKKSNPANLKNRKINQRGEDYSHNGSTCSEFSCLNTLRNTTNIPMSKIKLINFRIDRKGALGFSAPCHACQNLCRFLKVETLFYSNPDGSFTKYVDKAV